MSTKQERITQSQIDSAIRQIKNLYVGESNAAMMLCQMLPISYKTAVDKCKANNLY